MEQRKPTALSDLLPASSQQDQEFSAATQQLGATETIGSSPDPMALQQSEEHSPAQHPTATAHVQRDEPRLPGHPIQVYLEF